MSPLQALLFALGAIFTTIANAANPEEVAIGKIPGYMHGHPPRQSDFLTATFCYCALPSHVTDRKEEAHYFQFEYYNLHLDTTFILEQLCKASADDYFTCLRPRGVSETEKAVSEWETKVCRSWQRDVNILEMDRFCYIPHKNKWSETDDYMIFNRQRRNLGLGGGQAPFYQPQEMVDDVCTGFCDLHTGMPYLNDSKLAHNRILIYEDMDDMCDHCREQEE